MTKLYKLPNEESKWNILYDVYEDFLNILYDTYSHSIVPGGLLVMS